MSAGLDGLALRRTPGALDLAVSQGPGGLALRISAGPPAPLDALVTGQPASAVAELLPRLFSLCRVAQGLAARLALGLVPEPDSGERLSREILRDHLSRLFVFLPRAAGIAPRPLPSEGDGAAAVASRIFGPAGRLPPPADLAGWLDAGHGLAPLLTRIIALFPPGEAVADLPPARPETAFAGHAVENSPAARNAVHPLVADMARRFGKGPSWRLAGILADVERCLDQDLPAPSGGPGQASVPASRGLYSLRADVVEGRVSALWRRTPTDDMTMPGGVLERSVATLSPTSGNRIPLILALADPCVPVNLREIGHA